MNKFRLSYATVIKLTDQIAEVIVDEGVEMSLAHVEEYHHFLLSTFTPPFGILVNRKYSYTYSFEAMQELATLEEFRAIAQLTYTRVAEKSSRMLHDIKRKRPWNSQVFTSRDAALAWLDEQLRAD